jgi:predicted ferric reductase
MSTHTFFSLPVSGYTAFVNGIFHTYVAYVSHQQGETNNDVLKSFFVGDTINLSGNLLLAIITGMILTSVTRIRRLAFEVFYYFHIVFALCMLGCAFYHSGIVVPTVGSIVWGGDVLIRKVYMAYCRNPREASIIPVTDTVVEIKMLKTKGFDYNPGQYIKICFPDISLFEWHPISISSSPFQHDVTLHIRTRGSWTKRLYALSKKKNRVPVLIEGPYGSLNVDLTSKRYSMVMLISGGIGVTPMQSIAHQLVYEHEWGERHLKKLEFIWTSRDPQVVENMEVSSSIRNIQRQEGKRNLFEITSSDGSSDSSSASKVNGSASEFLKNNNLVSLPADFGTESYDQIEDIDSDDEDDDDSKTLKNFDIELGVSSETVVNDTTCTLSASGSMIENNNGVEEVLDLNCFITSKDGVKSDMDDLPFVHPNRPDIKKIFLAMREEAIRNNEKRVAVCICAPPQLVATTRKACVKYSNRHVRFDFHYEVFE